MATSGGDNNGFETTPANAYQNGGLYAEDYDSGTSSSTSCTAASKDKHLFYNYNVTVPNGSTINGIEVRLDTWSDSAAGTPKLCVQLSWNGGSSWTTAKSTANLGTAETSYILGSPTDTWGHTWNSSELNNSNFQIRIIATSSTKNRDFFLDWVAVQIHYQ